LPRQPLNQIFIGVPIVRLREPLRGRFGAIALIRHSQRNFFVIRITDQLRNSAPSLRTWTLQRCRFRADSQQRLASPSPIGRSEAVGRHCDSGATPHHIPNGQDSMGRASRLRAFRRPEKARPPRLHGKRQHPDSTQGSERVEPSVKDSDCEELGKTRVCAASSWGKASSAPPRDSCVGFNE
jgi:hypothetical protein